MTLLVRDMMSTPVVALFADQTMALAEDIMTFRHIRHLPVVDEDNHVIGVVTHRDLLRAQISSLAGMTATQRRARQRGVTARAIMTPAALTVTPETTAASAARTLIENGVGCVPVVDEAGALVGIVTDRDFLGYARDVLDAAG